MMQENIEVSVLCVTYNQKKYIRAALDSILKQETNFNFEIIIHDDCSTDGTHEILEEYRSIYADKIKLICPDINQYSQGIDFITPIIRNKANGKYIAICEGDDYWIDKRKIQLQYDILEEHPECDMSACWGCTVTEDGEREVSQIRPREGDGILAIESVILGGGQYLVTGGLFFRKSICDDMFGLDSLDYSLQMRGALRGGIFYLDRKMAVYRRYAEGSWTNNVLGDKERLDAQWEKERTLLKTLDNNTNGKYHDTINERLKAYRTFESQLEEHRDEIIKSLTGKKECIYMWGMGRRGKSLERFLKELGITISGVCDAVDQNIGRETNCGNTIVATKYVLKNATVIIASTVWAYEYLIETDCKAEVLDFQKYMPYG